ncbi:MAG TPA: DUF1294 domain-containing protein [Methanosarcina sp.]|nr:DUF1294 domain-containing protein [Methanosarcina sp.]
MTEKTYLLFLAVYIAFNAASFAIYGLDKFKASRGKWRISEMSLLIVSFFGPIGAWLGMQRFRHKTQKAKFKILVPVFLGIHIFLALWIILQLENSSFK